MPVFLDSSLPPLPRSSVPAWTTRVRYQRQLYHQNIHIYISGRTYAKNALGTNQLHQLVGLGANGVALGIGGEVAQITDVTFLISGSAVGLAEGVD